MTSGRVALPVPFRVFVALPEAVRIGREAVPLPLRTFVPVPEAVRIGRCASPEPIPASVGVVSPPIGSLRKYRPTEYGPRPGRFLREIV
ncbi:hypothetical protein LDC_1723 [sediment metagenome]|uniref:Uncharacterized protein n=1 Tax=sediment metagenome TaxID=749907 RepID=D9PJL2_9ZZZZ